MDGKVTTNTWSLFTGVLLMAFSFLSFSLKPVTLPGWNPSSCTLNTLDDLAKVIQLVVGDS